MRAASSSEASHMREGLCGWYVTSDPPVCHKSNQRLMRRLCGARLSLWWRDSIVALTSRVWLVSRALATGTGRWRGCTAQLGGHPLTHRGAHGCREMVATVSGPCLSRQGSTCFALASSRGEGETTAAHQGAWGVGGPGDSKAPRPEERRGARCWGGGRACTCACHQAGTQATWAGQEGTYTGPSSP
jgi:hypothetical protein